MTNADRALDLNSIRIIDDKDDIGASPLDFICNKQKSKEDATFGIRIFFLSIVSQAGRHKKLRSS